jgi:hypothetical protein
MLAPGRAPVVGMGQLGHGRLMTQMTHKREAGGFMGHSGLFRMTHQKSLMNQQVRRVRGIYGSSCQKVDRG